MFASFAAESIKLGRRPATWAISGIFLALIVLFGYLLNYLFTAGTQGEGFPQAEQFLVTLYPENFITNVLFSGFVGFGSALALVLGALAVGSEYGWDTFKSALTQRPGRLALFSGKLLTVAAILLPLTVLGLGVGALASYLVATAESAPVDWPALSEVVEAVGVGWLILGVFAAMGVFLATLFRGSALAITLGLVYLLVLENLFLAIPAENETFINIGQALPARNASDIVGIFGEPFTGGFESPGGSVEPTQALLVLVAYMAAFVLLSLLLFYRRDVT